jgi:hypothetical protein
MCVFQVLNVKHFSKSTLYSEFANPPMTNESNKQIKKYTRALTFANAYVLQVLNVVYPLMADELNK